MAPTPELEIAMFEIGPEGIKMLGRSTDPELVRAVRAHFLALRRAELARLEAEGGDPDEPDPGLHLVGSADPGDPNGEQGPTH